MEREILALLELQSFEFDNDIVNYFGTTSNYTVELEFNAKCCTLKFDVFDDENEVEVTLRDGFVDKVFALMEGRLQDHYAELNYYRDQMNHESYLWENR